MDGLLRLAPRKALFSIHLTIKNKNNNMKTTTTTTAAAAFAPRFAPVICDDDGRNLWSGGHFMTAWMAHCQGRAYAKIMAAIYCGVIKFD
jgi:hypothetical protein